MDVPGQHAPLTYFEIAFNTVRGDQGYYGTQTRPAFMQRGIPAVGVDFMNNVVVHRSLGRAVRFKGIGVSDALAAVQAAKFRHGGNRFDADYASELAAGDFDGDGRTVPWPFGAIRVDAHVEAEDSARLGAPDCAAGFARLHARLASAVMMMEVLEDCGVHALDLHL